MRKILYIFFVTLNGYLFAQQCISNAGQDKTVCGGKKVGSNYRVYLDGTGSNIIGGSINYEWSSLDEGVSFSNSQSKRADGERIFNICQCTAKKCKLCKKHISKIIGRERGPRYIRDCFI